MRELSIQEVEMVSGSGVIRDTTNWVGGVAGDFIARSIGSLVTVPVISTIVSGIAGPVGKQIGSLIGDAIGALIETIFGITDSSTDSSETAA